MSQETVPALLKRRSAYHYRYLLKLLQDVTPETALRDRRPHWPGHEWGIGQDGSIAGILAHLTAWKQMTLPLFAPGGRALTQEDFDRSAAPAPDDWAGIFAWFQQVGQTWNLELARLPETAFEETRIWANTTMPFLEIIMHIVEHDIMHAAQIDYLLQRNRAESKTPSQPPPS